MKPSLENPKTFTYFGEIVELVGVWGHGKYPETNFYKIQDILVFDDGDGHFFAYRKMPKKTLKETAVYLSPMFTKSDSIIFFENNCATVTPMPHDALLQDEDDNFYLDKNKYPNAIGY